jgi:hypothetical protein
MIHNVTFTGAGITQSLDLILVASGNYTAASAKSYRAKWLQVVNEGAATARMGDINTTAVYGLPLPATAGMFLPPVPEVGHTYSFTSIYFYVPSGTVVSLMFDA